MNKKTLKSVKKIKNEVNVISNLVEQARNKSIEVWTSIQNISNDEINFVDKNILRNLQHVIHSKLIDSLRDSNLYAKDIVEKISNIQE